MEITSSLDPRSSGNFTDTLTFGLVRPRTGLQHLIVKEVQRLRIGCRQGHDALDGTRRGSLTTGDYIACGNKTLKLTERYLCMPVCVKVHYTHELTAAAAAYIRSAQEQDSQHSRTEERLMKPY